MDYPTFLEQVTGRAQFEGPTAATRAIEATLHALAQTLPGRLVRELAAHFPNEVATGMLSATGPGASTSSDFYARIGERAGLSLSRGLEQAQIVCAVLGEQLDATLASRLAGELPDELAALLTAPERTELPLPPHPTGHGHSLANGRPGASHTLSEAKPGSRRPVSRSRPAPAQAHSVAQTDPHQESKISSAAGLTQEREHETLAEGRSKLP